MSLSENSARDDGDTHMDTDDTHFVQPAPPDKHPGGPETPPTKDKGGSEPGNTIMITNKYSNAGVMSQTHNSNNSIMILTAHSPDVSSITSSSQINICINNHFSDTITSSSATVTTDTDPEEHAKGEALQEPDSTTCHFKDSRSQAAATPTDAHPPAADAHAKPDFASGDEVLVRRADLYYLGTVMVVGRKQCCVSFGDDTKCWAYFQEMRKTHGDRGPVCVHCKEHSGQEPESVVDVCKRCHRGYHKKCSGLGKGGGVHCKRCFEQNSLNGVNGGKYFNKNNNLGDERLSYSDNSLSPFDTGNFFRSSDYKDAWSGSPNSDLSTGSSNGNYKGRKMSTCGRRLRERQEKNYAESTRRPAASSNPQASSSGCSNSDASSSSSSSSSLVNFSAATFLSQQLLSSQRGARGPPVGEKGVSVFSKIFDTSTPSHLANGDKYVIRGKRIDVDGNIQYLVEWEGVS